MSSHAGNSISADRDFSLSQSSSALSRNEIFYHNFMWNSSSNENACDSNGGRDDGDEGGTSKSEDAEVRMDLTDDLLHMVKCLDLLLAYIYGCTLLTNLTVIFFPRFFLFWTTLISVKLQWYVSSGEQPVHMKISGGV